VHPVEWAIGEAAGILGAFAARQGVTPKQVYQQPDRRTTYQYRLLARGVPIFWWSDVQFEDDPKTFAAAHLCAVNGVFSGGDPNFAFKPDLPATATTRKAIDDNIGRELRWPDMAMTRAEAAVFVCQQMGWPID